MAWWRPQFEARLINEHQSAWIEARLEFAKLCSLALYSAVFLLVRDGSLFLCVQPMLLMAFDIVPEATRRPLSFSQSSIRSTRRASGLFSACMRSHSRSTRLQLFPPTGKGSTLPVSLSRRRRRLTVRDFGALRSLDVTKIRLIQIGDGLIREVIC